MLGLLLGGALLLRATAGDEPTAKPIKAPPKVPTVARPLSGAKAQQVESLNLRIATLAEAGKFAEAAELARQVAELWRLAQGPDHWETRDALREAETWAKVAGLDDQQRAAFAGLGPLQSQAESLVQRGRYADAQPLLERILAIRRKALGEGHPDTATCYNNVAYCLHAQGRYADAQPLYDKALAIQRKVLGEGHPATALSYNNLATNLDAQGRYADAQPLLETALAIRRKALGEEHPDTATSFNNVAYNLNAQGRYADAQPLYEKALAICRKVLGEDHPDTARSYNNLASNLRAQGRYADAQPLYEKALAIHRKVLGEEHPDTAGSYNNVASNLQAQGRYADAQPLLEKALAIYRKVLGEEHPDTATSYNNLATNLDDQGRYGEAQPLYEKALAISRKVLGEEHPATAIRFRNVAYNLDAQGRYADAQPLYEKALAIFLKVLGEDHPTTAQSYNNLATNLDAQGRYGEAQPRYEKALAVRRKVLGEGHPDTARSYNNLAFNLEAQGRYADAQPLYENALVTYRKVLGEEHPLTATGYNNSGRNLHLRGRYADAQPLYEQALAIRRKALGEEHPTTVSSYNNVAVNLNAQGRYADAQPRFERALAIYRKVLGEEHPDTATSYNNLATNLDAQGRYADAQPLLEKALAIDRKALGEDHLDTALGYNNLAYNLAAQGRDAEAQPLYEKALAIHREVLGEEHPLTALLFNNRATNYYHLGQLDLAEQLWTQAADHFTRLRGRTAIAGLDRATAAEPYSPMLPLAALLARRGAAQDAWQRFESSLARGLLDDLSARQARHLSQTDRRREQEFIARLNRLDAQVERLAARGAKGQTDPKARDRLEQERVEANAEWSAFQHHLERTYGVAEGKVLDLMQIQRALSADAALVGWLDLDDLGEHWTVVVRHAGPPQWVALKGHGSHGQWTKDDKTLGARLAAALAERNRTAEDPTAAIRALAAQRIGPLQPLLQSRNDLPAVRRLIVLPAPALRGVPVTLLTSDQIVSYAPSGSVFAWLREKPRPAAERPPDLLAVADPAFTGPADSSPTPEPPGSGVLITAVGPGSNAAQGGLRPGDVLLEYGGRSLADAAALAPAIAQRAGGKEPIAMTAWRAGQRLTVSVSPGKLGVVVDQRPARQVILAQRDFDRLMRGLRGGSFGPLPGTRREAAALADLARRRHGRVQLLLGEQATETALHRLAADGALARFRYVHLATHGQPNLDRAFESTLALAQPNETEPPGAAGWADDGRLTAAEILRTWTLDADLVTLSACESAVGRYAGGEGYLGFTQALLLAGARSVVLSLWKVDDTATALLMRRFYEDLLGARADLPAPLPKAEALREAQAWLRGLTQSEADRLAASLPELSRGGTVKDARPVRRPMSSAPLSAAGEDRPFAHPYYWAAFVLVGDPD